MSTLLSEADPARRWGSKYKGTRQKGGARVSGVLYFSSFVLLMISSWVMMSRSMSGS